MTLVQTPNISQGILSNFHQHFIYQHSLHSSSDYVDLYCLLLSYIICIINISIMPYWHMHTIYIYIYTSMEHVIRKIWPLCAAHTIVYSPHVAGSRARLLPAKPGCLCQGGIGQRNRDSGPPVQTNNSRMKEIQEPPPRMHTWRYAHWFIPAVVVGGVYSAVR